MAGKADRADLLVGEGEQRDVATEGDQPGQGFQAEEGVDRATRRAVELLLVPDEVGYDVPAQGVGEDHQRRLRPDLRAQGHDPAAHVLVDLLVGGVVGGADLAVAAGVAEE